MQKQTKKLIYPSLVFTALIFCAISFQNCAQQGSTTAASTSVDGLTSSESVLTYPNTGIPVTLIPGQAVTLKIAKPAELTGVTNFLWVVKSDDYSLATFYGLPTETSDGYLYVSLSVVSSYTATKEMRLYFYNSDTSTYVDSVGLGILVNPSAAGSQYSADYISEMCDVRSAYVPTFRLNRSAVAKDALTTFDNGAGVGSLSCTFGSNAAVDCLTPSMWPTGWASLNLVVEGYNRCGVANTTTIAP